MQASDKRPEAGTIPAEQQDAPKRPLWSFATLGRKARLGPNRTIHGED